MIKVSKERGDTLFRLEPSRTVENLNRSPFQDQGK